MVPSLTPTAGHSQKNGDELTVCIPILKEVKLQVKSKCDVLKETKENKNDDDVTKCIFDGEGLGKEGGNGKIIHIEKEPHEVKSPTLSLLKAQDMMFDPKFMYKEYNLRRVRKQEMSPEASKPQKKKKLDKTPPGGRERIESKESDSKVREAELDVPEKVEREKRRGRSIDSESGSDLPECKKPREDDKVVEGDATSGKQKISDIGKHKTTTRLFDFSVSISRSQPHASPPLPVTLTKLLSMPKNGEQKKESSSNPPTQELGCSKGKNTVRNAIKKDVHTGSEGFGTKPAGRSQLICSLCKLKGGVSSLGFLFGPYFYQLETQCNADSNSDKNAEVWLHEDCAVWASGICLVGRDLKGLKEALDDANKMVSM